MYDTFAMKDCPCCGGSQINLVESKHGMSPDTVNMYYVTCTLCGLRTRTFGSKCGATNAWNTRSQTQDQLEVVTSLRDENAKLLKLLCENSNLTNDETKKYVG